MLNENASVFLRIPFNVTDAASLTDLDLRMKYDDGFVAYINGQQVAQSNAPGTPLWNSAATAEHDNDPAQSFVIPMTPGLISDGQNILAIQGLNISAGDDDFFISAELDGLTLTNATVQGYFASPTPGALNQTADIVSGPLIQNVTELTEAPADGDAIVITAEVSPVNGDVDTVSLSYRVMYGAETTVAMIDDATGADLIAGDGIYTALIPNTAAAPGEMVRWNVSATDENSNNSRAPVWDPLIVDQLNAPEYFGTVIADPTVGNDLPVLQWFLAPGTEGAARTSGGTRAGIFYNGEFYDNVFVRIRGGTTQSLAKNSYKFDFNRGNHFRFDPTLPRVEEFNLNTTYTDKAYVRQALAAEIYDAAGAAGFIAFPMRVQRNGSFFSVAMFIEQPDKDLLKREGLDPEGALYKMFNRVESGGAVEKKTRLNENNDDFNDFAANINNLSGEALKNYVFDNVNIPSVMNHLVATVLTQNADQSVKNYYLYRDSDGTGEWMLLPWDLDLTFGRHYMSNDTITDDEIWADKGHELAGRQNNVPISPSHPFVGEQEHPQNRAYNHLTDALFEIPEFREMYLRRLRTLMDEILQSPGTPTEDLILEARLDEMETQLTADVQLDLAEWANPWPYGVNYNLAQSIQRIKEEYLAVRRTYLFETQSIDNVAGSQSVTLVTEADATTAFVPTVTNGGDLLGTTWTAATFEESLDWQAGGTGVGYDRGPDFDPFIRLDVTAQFDPDNDAGTPNVNDSVFIRIPFSVDNTDLNNVELDTLTLRMKYDDAFVAYINGVQVAASNAPATPVWNSGATAKQTEALATVFEDFVINLTDLQASSGALVSEGNNVLAIHGLNDPSGGNPGTSSDLLILPELILSDSSLTSGDSVGIPQAQSTDYLGMGLIFGDMEHNPASGNQDEEYIEIRNPTSATAIDISGWQLTGGVQHTFVPGTVIQAGGSIYVSPDVATFRSRTTGPSGGQGLLVQGAYAGHLSNLGETVSLVAPDASVVASFTTPFTPSPAQEFLRISELNYNPLDPTSQEIADLAPSSVSDNSFEYIELVNISQAETLDLTDLTFSDGIDFAFAGSAVTSLAPGARLLIVRDQAAFEVRYGTAFSSIIAGEFASDTGLSNGGERVKIEDVDNSTVAEVDYDDGWYKETDGDGFSLVIKDELGPVESWDTIAAWRSSAEIGGSPGALDPEARVGDLNGDRNTSRVDVVQFLNNFGRTTGSYRTRGDVDLDGATSLTDLALIQANLGDTVASSPQASSQIQAADAVFSGFAQRTDPITDFVIGSRRAVRAQRRNPPREPQSASNSQANFSPADRSDLSSTTLRARRRNLRSHRSVQQEIREQQ